MARILLIIEDTVDGPIVTMAAPNHKVTAAYRLAQEALAWLEERRADYVEGGTVCTTCGQADCICPP